MSSLSVVTKAIVWLFSSLSQARCPHAKENIRGFKVFMSSFASLILFYYNSDITDVYLIINNITQTGVSVFVIVTTGLY